MSKEAQNRKVALFATCMLFLVLSISSCTLPNQTTHQTYSYHGPGAFNGDWRSGDHLAITWSAQPGPAVVDGTASQVVLLVRLILVEIQFRVVFYLFDDIRNVS